jgi:hypothetical protein
MFCLLILLGLIAKNVNEIEELIEERVVNEFVIKFPLY